MGGTKERVSFGRKSFDGGGGGAQLLLVQIEYVFSNGGYDGDGDGADVVCILGWSSMPFLRTMAMAHIHLLHLQFLHLLNN